MPCEVCHGKRYNRETLEVRYKGKSIADVLDMTINRAVEFFENVPQILNKIKVLQEVGLGYIKLGQKGTSGSRFGIYQVGTALNHSFRWREPACETCYRTLEERYRKDFLYS